MRLRGKKEVQPVLAQKSGAKSNSERSLTYRSEVYKDSKKHESLKERDRLRKAEERKKQKEMRNKNIALKAVYRIQEAKLKLSRTNERRSVPDLSYKLSVCLVLKIYTMVHFVSDHYTRTLLCVQKQPVQ